MSNRPKLLKKMFQVLKEGEDYNCPICYCYLPQTDLVTTRCLHTFCLDCILKCLKKKNTCPMCRRLVQQTELVTPAAVETSDTDDSGPSSSKGNSSLKVSSLIQLLEKSRDENPATKSVVFSQFHKMLMLLAEPLEVAGFRSLSLDGTLNEEVMAKVIREFGDTGPDAPTVLLASHQASGMGINLTAASRVYFLEPWWNAALENRAVDRVHQIGQKEEVKVVRIIARDTIEERILKLQKKRQDCNGGQDPGFLMEFDDEDLGVLMS